MPPRVHRCIDAHKYKHAELGAPAHDQGRLITFLGAEFGPFLPGGRKRQISREVKVVCAGVATTRSADLGDQCKQKFFCNPQQADQVLDSRLGIK